MNKESLTPHPRLENGLIILISLCAWANTVSCHCQFIDRFGYLTHPCGSPLKALPISSRLNPVISRPR